MTQDGLRLSAVVLTWNSRKWLDLCLSSVMKGMPYDSEVIVIDNGSTDGSWDEARRKFPSAICIRNDRNRGVAPGRNQGISLSRGRFVLLLDSDVVVSEGTILRLLEFAESDPAVGLVAPLLTYQDGRIQHSCRKFPTLRSKIQRILPQEANSLSLRDDEYEGIETWEEPREVDYAIGACQLVRRVALEEVGFLDGQIFYGPEDADLCLRLWLAGWKVMCLPSARVVHWEQRITRRRLTPVTLYHAYSLVRYFWKHRYLWSRKGIYERKEAVHRNLRPRGSSLR